MPLLARRLLPYLLQIAELTCLAADRDGSIAMPLA